jgi:hypothetical protein
MAIQNGVTDGAWTLSVTTSATGEYTISGTLPGDYAAGDDVDIVVSATVNSVAAKAVIDKLKVIAAQPYNSLVLGSDYLQVDAVEYDSATPPTPADIAAATMNFNANGQTVQARLEGIPTVADTSAEVCGDLATAHGAGEWTTADVSTLALEDNVETHVAAAIAASAVALEDNVETHVAAAIADAELAQEGAAMTLAAGAITSASFTVSAVTGVETGFLERMVQVWRRFFAKIDKTATELQTYDDAGTSVLTTQTIVETTNTQTVGAAT